MKSSVFRYIHISDFHLCIEPRRSNAAPLLKLKNWTKADVWSSMGKQWAKLGSKSLLYPASYEPELLSGTARFCKQKHETVDGVIITGDLSTTGMLDDLIVAEKFLNGTSTSTSGFNASIDFCREKVVTFPGNHDRYKDNFGDPNGMNFELKFFVFMPNFSDRVGHWVDAKEGLNIAFVYLDLSFKSKAHASKSDRYGRGRAYPEIVHEAVSRSRLLHHKYPNAHLIWVLHFATYECGDELKLENSNLVLDAAAECDVKAILNGHTHTPLFEYNDGIPTACAGSACSFDSTGNHALHIVEFKAYEDKLAISREDFIWNEHDQEFKESTVKNAVLVSMSNRQAA
jgi:predicted phosphodiesterase